MTIFQLLTFSVVIVYFFERPITRFALHLPERIKRVAHFTDHKGKKKK